MSGGGRRALGEDGAVLRSFKTNLHRILGVDRGGRKGPAGGRLPSERKSGAKGWKAERRWSWSGPVEVQKAAV